VQSIKKALDVLCCFTTDHPEWGVTELASYLGLCKSAVHRILTTCEQFQFVARTPDHRYRLGHRAVELGNVYRFDRGLLCNVEPVLRHLAEETDSIAHLGELDGREVLELARGAGPNAITFTRTPCFRGPAHATAMGKVLLAFGGGHAFRHYVGPYRVLKRLTRYTVTSPDDLRRELEAIAEQGYAVSDQESVLNCCCIAVPVSNRCKQAVAALSISSTPENFCDSGLMHRWRSAESS